MKGAKSKPTILLKSRTKTILTQVIDTSCFIPERSLLLKILGFIDTHTTGPVCPGQSTKKSRLSIQSSKKNQFGHKARKYRL